jgi:hypothetical protein
VPQEIARKTSTRRVTNPDVANSDGSPPAPSDADIIVEVIDEITFIDPEQQYQQFTWSFDNSDESSREVHVVTVNKDGPAHGAEGGGTLKVERVDEYAAIDSRDNYQETRTTLDNSSEDRFAVDYTPAPGDSRKTHDVKIHSKDGSAWLLIRRTDEFTTKAGADDQYWETVFALDQKDGDAGDPPPELDAPTTTWDGTTINPPWRLDPFQNIVDVSWGKLLVVFYGGNSIAAWPMSVLDDMTKFGEPLVDRVLAQSNWQWINNDGNPDHTVFATQLKISADFHPVVAGFALVEATGPSGEQRFKITTNGKYNCCDTGDFTGARVALSVGPNDMNPIINGAGTKIFAAGGNSITAVVTRDPATHQVTSRTLTVAASDDIYRPTVVTTGGEYYYGASNNAVMSFDGDGTPATIDFSQSYTQSPNPLPSPIPSGTVETQTWTPTVWNYVYGPGPDAVQVSSGGTQTGITYFGPPDTFTDDATWAVSVDCPFMAYQHASGGIDTVGLRWSELAQSGTTHREGDLAGHTSATVSGSASFNGVTTFFVLNTPDLVRFYSWPYWIDGIPYYWRFGDTAGSVYTPYGQTFAVEFGNGFPEFQGNFHASNGKHAVQGFDVSGTRHVFIDGHDRTALIAGKIGISASDIDCVLLDMKAGQIGSLI